METNGDDLADSINSPPPSQHTNTCKISRLCRTIVSLFYTILTPSHFTIFEVLFPAVLTDIATWPTSRAEKTVEGSIIVYKFPLLSIFTLISGPSPSL